MTNGSVPSIDYRVVAHRLEEDYLPDGNLSKSAWQGASRLTLVDTVIPQRSHPGTKTEASGRWSPEHLYIAFWCHYTELNLYLGEDAGQERWELWNRDVAEVFLTPFPESLHRYWEFEVAPNNLWIDLGIRQIERGMEWRINFFRCDGLGDDSRRRFLAWSPTLQLNLHVPERFGWI